MAWHQKLARLAGLRNPRRLISLSGRRDALSEIEDVLRVVRPLDLA